MKPSCEKFDQDLLMAVHGEISGWQNARLQLHLVTCPDCRARRKQLGALTHSLAAAFRNPNLGTRSFGRPNPVRWSSLGLGIILISSAGWLVASNLAAASTSKAAPLAHCELPHECKSMIALPPKPIKLKPATDSAKASSVPPNRSNLPGHRCD